MTKNENSEQYKFVSNIQLVSSFPPAKFKNLWFKEDDTNLYAEDGSNMRNIIELINKGWRIIVR